MSASHAELIREFLVETYENLDRLDQDLLALERHPDDNARISGIFRTIHTIKGTVGFLGFARLEAVAHVGENLLARLRDGRLRLDGPITTALLRMVDVIRLILAGIETSNEEPAGDDSVLIAELARLTEAGAAPAQAATPAAQPPADATVVRAADVDAPATDTSATAPIVSSPSLGDDARDTVDERRSSAADTSLRVDVSLLDRLMTLVGELVLARNQILRLSGASADAAMVTATGRLNMVTSELQEGVMKTRLQPIGTVWDRLPRVVRDVASMCGKQARVEMDGRETELDKAIIEAIKDPLTHVIRNSVDHGLELPDERVALGKPAEGTIRLRASHEGGQVQIEIVDDGRGIDAAKVKARAQQRGLITAEQATTMTESEALRLVFMPGFSTAERITNLSGRGVGMDVVKTNIESIGGQVDLHSVVGQGTTLRIKIPLTLAIVPALIVGVAGDRYAIPQASLLELVRLKGEQLARGIEYIGNAPFHRLRGRILPLVTLGEALGLAPPDVPPASANIVVLEAEGHSFGLLVDEITDTEEIVVKPLARQLKRVGLYAGATIMGDGSVALILDVLGIAQQARVINRQREPRLETAAAADVVAQTDAEMLLVFEAGPGAPKALPLAQVHRLEEFKRTAIEQVGPEFVVQYRGRIMRLVSVAAYFDGVDHADGPKRHVVVCGEGDQQIGLLVDRIVDIASEAITVQGASSRVGVVGTAVVQGRVTELVDVAALLARPEPSPEQRPEAA